MTNKTLVFATANEHKLSEIKNILPSYTILGLKDIGVYEDIVEDGATLEENALIKAKYLFEKESIDRDTFKKLMENADFSPVDSTVIPVDDSKNSEE